MKQTDYIFFDCMETLIDITELPSLRDYALWAYSGSGVESYWDDFEEFLGHFMFSRENYAQGLPDGKEYEISERFQHMARLKSARMGEDRVQYIAKRLYECYWKTYKAKCYIQEDVKQMIPLLAKQYHLGVVSNFMVENGIEELLAQFGMISYFDFIVTSIKEGWKKPHPLIYQSAIALARTSPDHILFIGDDYENDYQGPGKMGLQTIYLDRRGKCPAIRNRITSFSELGNLLF